MLDNMTKKEKNNIINNKAIVDVRRHCFMASMFFLYASLVVTVARQEAQLSPSDRAMRLVSSNLANYHATVQKLLIRQVLTKLMV